MVYFSTRTQTHKAGRHSRASRGVSLIWIIPLSIHEGKPAFSTAGTYSHNYAGPGHPGHPIIREVIPPPFEEAYTAWFDPANQLNDHPWSSLSNTHNALYQLRCIAGNAIVMVKILNSWHIRIGVLLICAGLLALYDKKRLRTAFMQARPWLLVLLIYPLAYLPFFIEGRYIYIEALLMLYLFFYLLQEMGDGVSVTPEKTLLFNILAVGAVTVYLTIQSFTFARQKIAIYRYARSLHRAQARLPFLQERKMVSDKNFYILATQLCYTQHARLYGVWSPAALQKVKQYHVEYLLTAIPRPDAFLQLQETIHMEKETLYVYKFIFK